MRFLITIAILSGSFAARCQVYEYLTPDSLGGITINLKPNNTFTWHKAACLTSFFASGQWRMKNDTLILTSDLQKGHIPVTYRESNSLVRDSLIIGMAVNLKGDLVKGATFVYNNDGDSCMPAFDACRFGKGMLKRIKPVLSDDLWGEWYTIKDPSTTYIEPLVNVDVSLDQYYFMKEEKFVKRGNVFYPVYAEKGKWVRGTTVFKRVEARSVNQPFSKPSKTVSP